MATVPLAKIVLYSFVNCMNISVNEQKIKKEDVQKMYYRNSALYDSCIKNGTIRPHVKTFFPYNELKYAEIFNKFNRELELLVKHGYVKYQKVEVMHSDKVYEYALTFKGKEKIKEMCKPKLEVQA